ncbi:hypothetical protein FHS15_001908 [Paenibacillus castaneae]|uniref:hypothetical protein n=1 Tax=Paenibacillus castaneae TaxID=474957 RepID=UPI000C9A4EB5|nr:hypothetical protein [Paenibacillus castaneae]NIK76783.1 hypothetical protein [Paenibacillus castaneae]
MKKKLYQIPFERYQHKKNRLVVFTAVSLSLVVVFGAVSLWIYSSKGYYPTLPFEGGTKKEIVDKLKGSNEELVELALNNGYYWIGFEGNQEDGRNKMIRRMEDQGLEYIAYEGSGIFFGNKEKIIITGTMWTRNYVLYKVPAGSYLSKA